MLQVRYSRMELVGQLAVAILFASLELLGSQLQVSNQSHAIPHFGFGFAVSIVICCGWRYVFGLAFGLLIIFGGILPVIELHAPSPISLLPGFVFAFVFFVLRNKLPKFNGINSARFFLRFIISICVFASLIASSIQLSEIDHKYISTPENLIDHFLLTCISEFNACLLMLPLISEFLFHTKNGKATKSPIFTPIIFIITLLVGQIVFFEWLSKVFGNIAEPYWLIFLLSIAALRTSTPVALLLLFSSTIQALLSVILNLGFFADDQLQNKLISINIYILTSCFISLLITYFLRETRELTRSMQTIISQLRVKEEALDAISQGVITTDAHNKITYTNKAFRALTGYENEELIGKTCALLQGEETSEESIEKIRLFLSQKVDFCLDILNYKKNGEQFWNELTIAPVFNHGVLTQFVGVQHDITWRKVAEHESSLAQVVFKNNLNAIVITDANSNILLVNPMFTEIMGYTLEEVRGKNMRIISSGMHDEHFYRDMWQFIQAQGHWSGEILNQRKDNTIATQHLSISGIVDRQHGITNYIGMYRDLSDEKKAAKQIASLQYKDQLTGLPNTTVLQQAMQSTLDAFASKPDEIHCAALLILDIDHFKFVNDALDHHVGDLLLIEVAKRLSKLISEQDTLCRQGGDEFKIFLPSTTHEATAELAQKILHAFANAFEVEEHKLIVTCSIGVALYPDDGITLDYLFRSADIALNQAKAHGKKRYLFHTKAMTNTLNERVALEQQLLHAAKNNEFRLFYQALVNVKTGCVSGFEALLRWQHPTLGWISPSKFIPLAEENDSISSIGTWVFNQACVDIRQAINLGHTFPPVAINLSPKQFQNKNLISELQKILASHRITPLNLGIEITEGVLMSDPVTSQATLAELRNLGFYLSLDDFGTGYSSLSYLKTFSFDKVKIDQSFIRSLSAKNQDAAIVIAIINMAHNLGIKVLAEGVETEAQCEFLRDHLIDEIQGYMFSKPLPLDQTLALLNEKRQLPAHLLRFPETTRTLLLVDDEQNIVSALKRLVRRDGYQILTANSGAEALEILEKNTVDVIVSDQRMPGMTGVEFLSQVKEKYPDTIRLMLSGYTELKSVTDAINEGAVFRFLTKPWDDEKLHACIKEAFQYKHYADDYQKLSLKAQTSSFELAMANRKLAELVDKKQNQLAIHLQSLEVVREALRHTSIAVIGLDDTPIIAFINDAAIELFRSINLSFGDELVFACPELYELILNTKESTTQTFEFNEKSYLVRWNKLGNTLAANGKIVTLTPSSEFIISR